MVSKLPGNPVAASKLMGGAQISASMQHAHARIPQLAARTSVAKLLVQCFVWTVVLHLTCLTSI